MQTLNTPEKKYEVALSYSLPHYKNLDLRSWCFSGNEAELLNCIALTYAEMGDFAGAIRILSDIRGHYEDGIVSACCHLHPYGLTLQNLSALFGLAGKHEDAIEIAKKLIFLSVHWGNANFLSPSLYSKAWNMEKIMEKEGSCPESIMDACKKHLVHAFHVAAIMGHDKMAGHIAKHYKCKYETDIMATEMP